MNGHLLGHTRDSRSPTKHAQNHKKQIDCCRVPCLCVGKFHSYLQEERISDLRDCENLPIGASRSPIRSLLRASLPFFAVQSCLLRSTSHIPRLLDEQDPSSLAHPLSLCWWHHFVQDKTIHSSFRRTRPATAGRGVRGGEDERR